MPNIIVAIILVSFAVEARSGIYDRAVFESHYKDGESLAFTADLPNESNAVIENEIMAAVKTKIDNSLIDILNVEARLTVKGKKVTKVSCSVLNIPCLAYLMRVNGEWEVMILITTEMATSWKSESLLIEGAR